MLSSLSSIADRNFVIAFLMPALLAGLALLWIFHDTGAAQDILTSLVHSDTFAALTLLAVGLWSAAVLLMILNTRLYRVLEGYELKFLTSWRKAKTVKIYDAKVKKKDATPANSAQREKLERELFTDYPQPQVLMPTRFGNLLRAAEAYSLRIYGVDSINSWLRLTALIPADFSRQIDSARAEADFFVNSAFLSGLIAIVALLRILRIAAMNPIPLFCDWWWLPVGVLAGMGASWLAYQLAVMCIRPWGDLVRSAFDLYLPTLAKQLGYELPATEAKRRAFWDDVNEMLINGVPMKPEKWILQPQPITQTTHITAVTIDKFEVK